MDLQALRYNLCEKPEPKASRKVKTPIRQTVTPMLMDDGREAGKKQHPRTPLFLANQRLPGKRGTQHSKIEYIRAPPRCTKTRTHPHATLFHTRYPTQAIKEARGLDRDRAYTHLTL